MNRKETTEFLSNLLIERLSGRGKYYASEARVELKKASLFFTKSRVARLITIAATA